MTDRLYCLSDPAEPGLVRVTMIRNANTHQNSPDDARLCRPGEKIDWSLKVRDARSALKAVHRSMRRYRKSRGDGVYRCSPMDAREIAIRYTATRSSESVYATSQQVNDNLLASMLVAAFLLSIFFAQSVQLGTAPALGISATVLATLSIGYAMLRGNRVQ